MNDASDSEGEPSMDEVEARMRPGAFSQRGFLGPNERLRDVLQQDAETLAALGVRYEQIADGLQGLIERALASSARRVRVGSLFSVRVEQYKGFQMCPWASAPHQRQCSVGRGVQFASLDWEISNHQRNLRVRGPGLIVHLIRDHHFFEGVKAPYRLEPSLLTRLLELSSEH